MLATSKNEGFLTLTNQKHPYNMHKKTSLLMRLLIKRSSLIQINDQLQKEPLFL